MRLPLIPPAELTAEQRPVYDDMKAGIEKNFQGFKTIADNGALEGPWNPWLHEPKFGKPIWDLTLALSVSPSLPRPVREVAILVTGAGFTRPTSSMPMSSPANGADCPTTSSPPSSPASARPISPRKKALPTMSPRRCSTTAPCRS